MKDLRKTLFWEAYNSFRILKVEFHLNRLRCNSVLTWAWEECRAWGVDGKQVIVLTRFGRILFEVLPSDDVYVTFVPLEAKENFSLHPDGIPSSFVFQAEKKYLKIVSEFLRNHMELQYSFDQIFSGEMNFEE